MENIAKFVMIDGNSSYSNGAGYGAGYDSGDGYSYGYVDDTGDGSGYSNGSGYGSGTGSSNSSGEGYLYGGIINHISRFNNTPVYLIDGVQTGIIYLKDNIAKGFILNNDLTTTSCYVVRQNNLFAHGATFRQAVESLREKLFDNLTDDERISEFLRNHNPTDKYTVLDLYDWHNKLTGSCELGRKQFMMKQDLTFENMFTVNEFVELTKNDYGSEVIKKLAEKVRFKKY